MLWYNNELSNLIWTTVVSGPCASISSYAGYEVYYIVKPWLAKKLASQGENVYQESDGKWIWQLPNFTRGQECSFREHAHNMIEHIVLEELPKYTKHIQWTVIPGLRGDNSA